MIKPLSVQRTYTLIYSGDPALDRPVQGEQSDEDHAKAVEEFDRKVGVCRDTSDWREMVIPGKQPVAFQMRQVKPSQFDWLEGTVRRQKLGPLESQALLFRLALSQVDGLDGAHFKDREPFEGQLLAPVEAYDVICDAPGFGRAAIVELADIVYARCLNPIRPLS